MVGLSTASPGGFCRQNLHCLRMGVYRDGPRATGVATITASDAQRMGVKRDTPRHRERGVQMAPLPLGLLIESLLDGRGIVDPELTPRALTCVAIQACGRRGAFDMIP